MAGRKPTTLTDMRNAMLSFDQVVELTHLSPRVALRVLASHKVPHLGGRKVKNRIYLGRDVLAFLEQWRARP